MKYKEYPTDIPIPAEIQTDEAIMSPEDVP
jgi:hypothetical protein